MYAIEKKMTFEAAHFLSSLESGHPCKVIHGHSYKLYIKIYSEILDDKGFILDFNKLKKFQTDVINAKFDHSMILTNSQYMQMSQKEVDKIKKCVLPHNFSNTSAENLCKYIYDLLVDFLEGEKVNYNKIKIRLFETENNCAEFSQLFKK